MDYRAFQDSKPARVCDTAGPDEDHAVRHFQGKDRDDINYADGYLVEDLIWMSHKAFLYYLPGFLEESLRSEDGDLASNTLTAISSQLSGPRAERIVFSEAQAETIKKWMQLVLQKFGEDEGFGFQKRIEKYTARI